MKKLYIFVTMLVILGLTGCECRWLKISELKNNFDKAISDIEWADIIYEGGGDTVSMMKLWIDTGFDKLLKKLGKKAK